MSSAARKLFLLHLVANALLLWLAYEWLGVGESTRLRLLGARSTRWRFWRWPAGFTAPRWSSSAKAKLKIKDAFACVAAPGSGTSGGGGPGARALWFGGVGGGRERPAGIPAGFLADVETAYTGEACHGARGFSWEASGLCAGCCCRLRCCRWRPVSRRMAGAASAKLAGGRGWRYWLEVPLLLVAGLLLPFVVLGWVPAVSGFALEVISFSVRMLVAYLLFVGAVWTLERRTVTTFVPGGRPS